MGRKTTINARAGFGEIKGDHLQIVAFRGTEIIRLNLRFENDLVLVAFMERVANLIKSRRKRHIGESNMLLHALEEVGKI